mgnify:CR=1 FL=1
MGASRGLTVVPHPGLLFTLSTIITQTTGTIFVMWLGEEDPRARHRQRHLAASSSSTSLGRAPNAIFAAYDSFRGGTLSLFTVVFVLTR